MKFCKDCKWFKNKGEVRLSNKFINGEARLANGEIEPHAIYLDLVNDWGNKHCQHPICFLLKYTDDFIHGLQEEKIRVKGCAQLNSDFKCVHYKRKWWKFWIKKETYAGTLME